MNKDKLLESVEVVGEVFPSIKSCVVDGFFEVGLNRLSEMDEIVRCVTLFGLIKNIRLSSRKIEILSYYLKFGYSSQTKEDLLKLLGITHINLNVVNSGLRKDNLLIIDAYNKTKNSINAELAAFKEFIVDGKGENVLLKIK